MLAVLRHHDRTLGQRASRYIAISKHIAQRIEVTYGRAAEVIYPPVDTQRFKQASSQTVDDYFLVVSRLVPYKRVDLVVDAFNRLGLKLRVAGNGPALSDLRRHAGPTIEFLGRVADEELPKLMARCRALVFPGEEDFGITPVEAMAAGRPVIPYAAGGALETVEEGISGIFMQEQTVDALAQAVRAVETIAWDTLKIQERARRFDAKVFESNMLRVLGEVGCVDQRSNAVRRKVSTHEA